MLSVIWEAPIKDFQIKEHSFEEVSAEPPTPGVATGIGYLVLPGITLKGYGTVIRQRLDDAKVARLKDRLESKLPTADFYYQKMFIAALDSDDTVARFMMLYLIGLSLFGESQQQFDTEIRRLEPSVTFSPGHSGRPESVYTKLRNQIGHVRPGTTIDQTRGEMSQRLRGLTNIIKQLLDERAT